MHDRKVVQLQAPAECIPLQAQAMIASFVEQLLRCGGAGISMTKMTQSYLGHPNSAAHGRRKGLVLLVNAMDHPIRIAPIERIDFERQLPPGGGEVVRRYLAELVEDPDIYMVSIQLLWGGYFTNLLVRLRRVGNGDFRALSATSFVPSSAFYTA